MAGARTPPSRTSGNTEPSRKHQHLRPVPLEHGFLTAGAENRMRQSRAAARFRGCELGVTPTRPDNCNARVRQSVVERHASGRYRLRTRLPRRTGPTRHRRRSLALLDPGRTPSETDGGGVGTTNGVEDHRLGTIFQDPHGHVHTPSQGERHRR